MKNKYIEQIEEKRRINKRRDLYLTRREIVSRVRREEEKLFTRYENGFDLVHVSTMQPFSKYKLAKEMYKKGFSIHYGTWGVSVARYRFKYLAWLWLKVQYIIERY